MRAYLKQSGELLTDDPTKLWTPSAVYKSAERIADVHERRRALHLSGLMVMSGAGNIIRGADMRKDFGSPSVAGVSDVLGRMGTMQNALMLHAALQDLDVPTQLLVAPGMKLEDGSLKHNPLPYSLQAEHDAGAAERVVLMLGGDGQNNSTTDGAMVNLAYRSALSRPEEPHRVLKATQVNGIYDRNPHENADAQRFAIISAAEMLEDTERFAAVDERCLRIMSEAPDNLTLQVYAADEFEPVTVLSRGLYVGTLVMPGQVEAVAY